MIWFKLKQKLPLFLSLWYCMLLKGIIKYSCKNQHFSLVWNWLFMQYHITELGVGKMEYQQFVYPTVVFVMGCFNDCVS